MRTDPRTAAALALYLDGVQAGIEAVAEVFGPWIRAGIYARRDAILAEARKVAEDMIDDGDWPEVDAVLADKTGDKIGGGSVIADALEAQLSKIPGEFETRLAALEARHARLGAKVGDEIRALRHRVGELEDRVERLGDDSQEHHDRLWTTADALAARETPIRETQPAERLTGDPQTDGHGHSHEHT